MYLATVAWLTSLLYVMIILAHDRRKIVRFDVTQHPTAAWLSQQVTEAFPWDTAPRYLLRDRDASYSANFRRRVAAMGITEVVTAPRAPWQNAHVERGIGSIRRKCAEDRGVAVAGGIGGRRPAERSRFRGRDREGKR